MFSWDVGFTSFASMILSLLHSKEPVVDVSEDEEDEDENFWDKESFWLITVFVVPA